MAQTYVPVILNNAPELTVTQLNTTTITNSGAITTNTLTATGAISGASGDFTGQLEVDGTAIFNGNINCGTINPTLVSIVTSGDAERVFQAGDSQPRYKLDQNGAMSWGPGGAAAPDTTLNRTGVNALSTAGFFAMGSGQSSGTFNTFATGNNALRIGSAGGGLSVRSGANATIGTATLTAGSATVSTTRVTATSLIFLTIQSIGTVTSPKAMTILNKTAGVSFQIVSADATDTSTVAWWIVETV